ncbi:unnamed protein product [Auanema sp. JU1783]|nr:unnamed protein product [Auanema sp. JU1783]
MPILQAKPLNSFFQKFKPFKKSHLHDIDATNDMGQYTSILKKKDDSPINRKEAEVVNVKRGGCDLAKYASLLRESGIVPEMFLIKESQSSKFVDEDGHVANEFLTERLVGPHRRLCKVVDNIKPKGKEKYDIPRLSPDLPVVIWEINS